MLRFLKTLLLSLLMLALPVQGLAAAVGLSCGPAHQHGLEALNALNAFDGHAPDAATEDAGHAHHAAHEQHAHHQATDTNDDAVATDLQAAASTCSACAACCVGAVIPPSAMNLAPVDHGTLAAIAAPTSPFAGHIPDGLKRPPRPHLV